MNGDGVDGFDLDDCRNVGTKMIDRWALEIVKRFNSYTELSPSGTGLRIFLRGKLPAAGRHKGGIEVYDSKKFLSVTGRKLTGHGAGDGIADRSAELLAWHREVFGHRSASSTKESNGQVVVNDPPDVTKTVSMACFRLSRKPRRLSRVGAVIRLNRNGTWHSPTTPRPPAGAQETADLLVQARQNAGEAIKPADYFTRTIATARNGKPDLGKPDLGKPAPEPEEPEPEEPEPEEPELAYISFPTDALPTVVANFIHQGAAALGCDESYIALPLLATLASAVGNSRRICLKRTWREPAMVWALIVGESGTHRALLSSWR